MLTRLKLLMAAGIACLSVLNTVNAQVRPYQILNTTKKYYEIGIKAGANFQQLSAYPFAANYNLGGTGGIYVTKRMDMFGLQLEVTASTAKYTTEYPVGHNYTSAPIHVTNATTKGEFNALYLDVPLLFEVRPVEHFVFQLGGQYTYLLSFTDENGAFTKRYCTTEVLKKSNISAVAGIEVDIYKGLKIAARYSAGLLDVNSGKFKPLTDKWLVNGGQITLIYRLDKFGMRYM